MSGPWRSAPRGGEPESPPLVAAEPEPIAVAPTHQPTTERPHAGARVAAVERRPHRSRRAAMAGWIVFGFLFAAGCVGLAFLYQPQDLPPEVAGEAVPASTALEAESAPAVTAGAVPGDAAAAAAGEAAAGASPEPTTIAGVTNVRLRTGTGFAEADRDAVVAALGKAGLSDVQVEPLPFAVASSRVGYYRPEDRAAAETLAAYIAPVLGYARPIAVRDYGALLEGADPGRLDLWIGG